MITSTLYWKVYLFHCTHTSKRIQQRYCNFVVGKLQWLEFLPGDNSIARGFQPVDEEETNFAFRLSEQNGVSERSELTPF